MSQNNQRHFAGRRHTFQFVMTFASTFMMMHPCDYPLLKCLSFFMISLQRLRASLCSSVRCFGTHIAQILWYPRLSRMREHEDAQLMFSFSAVSVNVVRLFSWIRELVQYFSPFEKWSEDRHQQWRFCHFWTFLPIATPFSVLCYSFLVNLGWFHPLWPQNSNDSMLPSDAGFRNRGRHVYTMIASSYSNIPATSQHA